MTAKLDTNAQTTTNQDKNRTEEKEMDTTAQTTPTTAIYTPKDNSLEEWTKFRISVNSHFTGTDDAQWNEWNESVKNNPIREMSRQEWAEFVEANKQAHTPTFTDEMAQAVSNEITVGERVVTRHEAQIIMNVAHEAECDLRSVSRTKTLNFDNMDEIRALDAKVARLSELVISVSKAL